MEEADWTTSRVPFSILESESRKRVEEKLTSLQRLPVPELSQDLAEVLFLATFGLDQEALERISKLLETAPSSSLYLLESQIAHRLELAGRCRRALELALKSATASGEIQTEAEALLLYSRVAGDARERGEFLKRSIEKFSEIGMNSRVTVLKAELERLTVHLQLEVE